ncbi:MAG: CDP-diacylglycerol--glycerol-3-phosphate 3-phosphatidyltransferase [Micrococcales bacterium]|nr:CDP-diacylglycerol--glycerol-3-phosphate 3-phosphatidyltransferase [Micrococcales bacterium]
MFRIVVVPVFVVVLVVGADNLGLRLLAVGLFLVAAATDKLDGWLARRWDQVTDLGKLLDPIADKLLMGAALVALSALGELWWPVTAVILVREVGITVLRFVLLRRVVLPASSGGKLKTVLQSAAIGLFLLPLARLPAPVTWLAWATMAVALVVTVVTGVDYLRTAARMKTEARGAH